MAASLTGNFERLAGLWAQVRKVQATNLRADVAKAMGAAALSELQRGFRTSTDPYGKPWARLRLRQGKPLLDTGRLRSSFAYYGLPDGFRISSGIKYAGLHQRGGTIVPKGPWKLRFQAPRRKGRWYSLDRAVIPARRMLPTVTDGGFGNWHDPLKAAGEQAMVKFLRR